MEKNYVADEESFKKSSDLYAHMVFFLTNMMLP